MEYEVTHKAAKTPLHFYVTSALTFLFTLPFMWAIGNLAVFYLGFIVWLIPYLLGIILVAPFLPQTGHFPTYTEFDGAIIGFALFGAIQNALIVWFWMKRKLSIWFILVYATVLILAVAFLLYFDPSLIRILWREILMILS